MANVNIRVDDALKAEVEKIFATLGLSLSTATNVYYRQVVRHGGIPFDLRVDTESNKMKSLVNLAKEKGKILSVDEVFEKYPPEGKWSRDKDGNIILKEL